MCCPRPDRDRARATCCGSRSYACTGDIICCLDADLRNFRGEYVERLCAPLLADPDTMFVKAYYTRSFEGAPTGGGRVTELVARPLLSLLFPKLADIVQPLGGEYAARRSALEVLPFVEGWGVELGLLVDIVERFGRDAVAQVDLGRARAPQPSARRARAARSRSSHRVRTSSSARRAYVELLHAADGCDRRRPVEVRERPPMITRPGVPSAFRPASIAASSTSNAGARAYASSAATTRSVEREHFVFARRRARARASSVTWPAMTATRATSSVVGPREHAADDLAREARRVELPFAGHARGRRRRTPSRARPPRRRRRNRARARRRSRRARPRDRRPRPRRSSCVDVDARARAVLLGELLEPPRRAARPARRVAPFCGP